MCVQHTEVLWEILDVRFSLNFWFSLPFSQVILQAALPSQIYSLQWYGPTDKKVSNIVKFS